MVTKMSGFFEQRAVPSMVPIVLVWGFLFAWFLGGSPASAAVDTDVCPVWSLVDRVFSARQGALLPLPTPLEVDGNSLDNALNLKSVGEGYTSILFYAAWCPFSLKARAEFDSLSFMFSHIRHLAVEESSALPSVFSRYGVHSLPSFLIANKTSRVRYQGPKDINSLALFYKEITGAGAEVYPGPVTSGKQSSMRSSNGCLREILMRERYLVISTLQEQATHVLNLKRLCSMLRQTKMRKFHEGASNARVWASSLASVSLGESSSSSARTDTS